MPKTLSEVRAHPPTLFVDLGDSTTPEADIALNSVRAAFEVLTGKKLEPKASVGENSSQPSNDTQESG